MSSDNYITIIRGFDGRYRGYMRFVSNEGDQDYFEEDDPLFEAETMEEAVIEAQSHYTEYGYSFGGLKKE